MATTFLALAVTGCKSKEEPKAKQPVPKKPPVAAPGNSPGPASSGRQTVGSGAPSATNWSAEKRAEFCKAVFGVTDVTLALGFHAEDVNKVQVNVLSTQARTAGCKYTLAGEPKKPPRYDAQLMIDCRRGMLHTPEMTRRGFLANKPAKLEDVAIGKGGTYAHFRVAMGTYKAPIHQVNFIHDEPRCSITVVTRFVEKDLVRELAKHVEGRIDKDTAPF